MWRYLAGAGAGVLLVVAGMTLQAMRPGPRTALAAMPAAAAATDGPDNGAVGVPEATAKTREEKRFNRYDKDRNGAITRDEYLASRKKAYAKLDVDGNGTLSFDEWATKAEAKFALADKDKSGAMNAVEFATTAVKRKEPVRAKCPPGKPVAGDGKDDDS
ncbi:MAG: EF-hand domain-containing protein [Pseudomonadota bacterium]